jgi:hypothetical protein
MMIVTTIFGVVSFGTFLYEIGTLLSTEDLTLLLPASSLPFLMIASS